METALSKTICINHETISIYKLLSIILKYVTKSYINVSNFINSLKKAKNQHNITHSNKKIKKQIIKNIKQKKPQKAFNDKKALKLIKFQYPSQNKNQYPKKQCPIYNRIRN